MGSAPPKPLGLRIRRKVFPKRFWAELYLSLCFYSSAAQHPYTSCYPFIKISKIVLANIMQIYLSMENCPTSTLGGKQLLVSSSYCFALEFQNL
jgi:hypothetical protein